MKRWIGFTFLMTLISLVTMGSSCRHLAEPTFPPTNTFTPTATVAVTATKTPTSTVTGTPTSTITPGGPTFTPTSSPTLTPTSTITSTPSGPSVFQNFDGSSSVPTGWSSNNNNEGTTITVPALAISTAQFHSSPNSAWIQIPFTIAGESANIQYAYTSNPGVAANCANLTGKTISFYYYVDVAPSAGAYGTVWVQDGGTPVSPATAYDYQSYGFAGGTYAVAIGAWTQASIPANQGGVDPSDIWQFGIQIGTGTGTGSGTSDATVNFYIDDVTIQ